MSEVEICTIGTCCEPARGDVDAAEVGALAVPAHHCRQCANHCQIGAYIARGASA